MKIVKCVNSSFVHINVIFFQSHLKDKYHIWLNLFFYELHYYINENMLFYLKNRDDLEISKIMKKIFCLLFESELKWKRRWENFERKGVWIIVRLTRLLDHESNAACMRACVREWKDFPRVSNPIRKMLSPQTFNISKWTRHSPWLWQSHSRSNWYDQ